MCTFVRVVSSVCVCVCVFGTDPHSDPAVSCLWSRLLWRCHSVESVLCSGSRLHLSVTRPRLRSLCGTRIVIGSTDGFHLESARPPHPPPPPPPPPHALSWSGAQGEQCAGRGARVSQTGWTLTTVHPNTFPFPESDSDSEQTHPGNRRLQWRKSDAVARCSRLRHTPDSGSSYLCVCVFFVFFVLLVFRAR